MMDLAMPVDEENDSNFCINRQGLACRSLTFFTESRHERMDVIRHYQGWFKHGLNQFSPPRKKVPSVHSSSLNRKPKLQQSFRKCLG
jgi:hypothetical protein